MLNANTRCKDSWRLKYSKVGFFAGVNILVTISLSLSVSSSMIFKNFFEKSSSYLDFRIWALPLIPDKGFFTSCARVLAKPAAIFWVEKFLVESIILFRLSILTASINTRLFLSEK